MKYGTYVQDLRQISILSDFSAVKVKDQGENRRTENLQILTARPRICVKFQS